MTGAAWSVITPVMAYLLIDPVVAWADKRYVTKVELQRIEFLVACQSAEEQIDQIQRLLNRTDENTAQEIVNDYKKQLGKHQDRYKKWGCDDILDAAVPELMN